MIAAASFALSNLGWMPHGGVATSLPPLAFALVVAVSFVLGVLMNLGVGNFAPTLILIGLLRHGPQGGLSDHDGLLGAAAADQRRADRRRPARGPAHWCSAWRSAASPRCSWRTLIVKGSLPLDILQMAVVAVVVTYAGAVSMLRARPSRARRPPNAVAT